MVETWLTSGSEQNASLSGQTRASSHLSQNATRNKARAGILVAQQKSHRAVGVVWDYVLEIGTDLPSFLPFLSVLFRFVVFYFHYFLYIFFTHSFFETQIVPHCLMAGVHLSDIFMSTSTPQQTTCVSLTKYIQLMILRSITHVCSENHKKRLNALCVCVDQVQFYLLKCPRKQ